MVSVYPSETSRIGEDTGISSDIQQKSRTEIKCAILPEFARLLCIQLLICGAIGSYVGTLAKIKESPAESVMLASWLGSAGLGWTLTYLSMHRLKMVSKEGEFISWRTLKTMGEVVWFLWVCGNVGASLIFLVSRNPYHLDPTQHPHPRQQHPDVLMAFSLFLPTTLSMIVPKTPWIVIGASWMLLLTSNAVAIGVNKYTNSWYTFAFVVPFSLLTLLMLYDNNKQNMSLQRLDESNLSQSLEDDRQKRDAETSELRHMIGNVAHDLKTPLAGFMSGAEYIIAACEELLEDVSLKLRVYQQQNLDNHDESKHVFLSNEKYIQDLLHKLRSIDQSAGTMMSINSFMLMTINRCIDYTKLNSGLKLKPRLETINLKETLHMPYRCVKDVHEHVEIVLAPLPKAVCTHIVTDKQWLQENVLCLLSNASKYSANGSITIRVKLERGMRKKSFGTNLLKERSDADSLGTLESLILQPASRRRSRTPSMDEKQPVDFYGMLRVEVEDTGIGLTEEKMKTLFQPFKTTQRMAGGTGLGLFSLARRVEALNGKYGGMPRADGQHGSVFWFEIPYIPDTCAAESSSSIQSRSFTSRSIRSRSSGTSDGSHTTYNRRRSSKKPMSPTAAVFLAATSASPVTVPAVPENATSTSTKPDAFEQPKHSIEREAKPEKAETSISMRNIRINTAVTPHGASNAPVTPISMARSVASKHSSQSTSMYTIGGATGSNKLDILLAEDTPSIQKMMKRLLEKKGYTVTVASNGSHAFDRVIERYRECFEVQRVVSESSRPAVDRYAANGETEKEAEESNDTLIELYHQRRPTPLDPFTLPYVPFDVVLMDFQMPVMDGLEAIKRIREWEADYSAKNNGLKLHQLIIGSSANSDRETMQEGYSAGMDGFVAKPFTMAAFEDAYASILEEQQMSTILANPIDLSPK